MVNSTTVKENETKPCIEILGRDIEAGDSWCFEQSGWTTAGKGSYDTKTVNVSATGGDVKGTITVEPIRAADFPADKNAKVTAEKPAWYQYRITESGRYLFESTGEGTTTDFFYFDGTYRQYAANETYLRSGVVICAKVSTTFKEEKTAVLKTPEKINPETLEADKEVTVKPAEGKSAAYYIFTAASHAEYTFVGAENLRYAVPQADGSEWIYETTVTLEKDQKVLVKALRDAKLKVTKSADVTKLEVGAASGNITLAKGQKAVFSYNIFKNGRYAFETSTDKVTIGAIEGAYRTTIDKNAFKVCMYRGAYEGTFAVTNPTEEAVTFQVSVTKVVPRELTLDKAESVKKTDNADRYEFFSFKASENNRYVFKNTAKNEVAYMASMGENGVESPLWANAQYLEKYSEVIDNDGSIAVAASENYDISVSKLQPKPAALSEEGTEVAFKAADIKWISFTADKAGEYSFTVTGTEVDEIYLYERGLQEYTGFVSLDSPLSCRINKNGSVYFRIEAAGDINLKVTAALTKEILAFETGKNAIDASENQMDAFFTAPETGVYTLNAALEAGDHIVVNISESDRWLYTNQKISYVLAADESLYFTAPQGTKGSITIGKEASMRDLTQDTNT